MLNAKAEIKRFHLSDETILCNRGGTLRSDQSDVLMDHLLLLKAALDPLIVEVGKK
jgi:hypothetical protein